MGREDDFGGLLSKLIRQSAIDTADRSISVGTFYCTQSVRMTNGNSRCNDNLRCCLAALTFVDKPNR